MTTARQRLARYVADEVSPAPGRATGVRRVAVDLSLAGLALAVGCAGGGGPFVGYGLRHGLVYGAEVGAGAPLAQVTVGAQNVDLFTYGRVDLMFNYAQLESTSTLGAGARLGAGYGISESSHGAAFAIGGTFGWNFKPAECEGDNGLIGLLGLELRYAKGEIQFVATTRVDTFERTATSTLGLPCEHHGI